MSNISPKNIIQKLFHKAKVKAVVNQYSGEIFLGIVVGFITLFVFQPTAVSADVDSGPYYPGKETVALLVSAMQNKTEDYGTLPKAKDAEARQTFLIPVTAYSSTVDQCDDDPFITATGEHVYDGGIAANFLPFGTKVRIPEVYGDKVFTVNDRMNSRYYYRADIWMPTREEAIQFGLQYVTIEVF